MIAIAQSGLALLEGMGLAFSPCILPILPLILATTAVGNRWRPFEIVAGFILSFTLLSLVSRQLLALTGIQLDQIQFTAFLLLLAFGLIMLIPQLEEKFAGLTNNLAGKAQKATQNESTKKMGGGLLVGALIGVVWTPCAGPILAVALLQVIQSHTNLDAVLTILAFSIGAGIPMLLIAYFGQTLTHHTQKLLRHSWAIRRGMGVVVTLFALMGLYGFNLGEWVVSRAEATVTTSPVRQLQNGVAMPYPAPEIAGIENWVNSPPLTLSAQKGKVVLIDFWTYSCINCIRTLPHLKAWYSKYHKDGLEIIGVHSPEFSFEENLQNVQAAVKKFGLTYPIALDNRFTTWNNFSNRYWPAHYLINKEGQVVYVHFGEGQYDITENNIRFLLGKDKQEASSEVNDNASSWGQTPETYLGLARSQRQALHWDELDLHHWAIQGKWQRSAQYLESKATDAELKLHYHAQKVFLVMESADGQAKAVTIIQDRQKKSILVKDSELYQLVNNPNSEDKTLVIHPAAGTRIYAFTFG